MRALADRERIRLFMEAVAREAGRESRVYLVGGTTAVMMGWRSSTVDVDLVVEPEDEAILRAIPVLKERLQLNVELASPADFIPLPEGWESRSRFIERIGRVTFLHFDLYSQALAKVERGHERDLADVREMIRRGLVDPARALEYFTRIEPELYRFPSIHAPAFRRAAEAAFGAPRT